ncbi:23S rRNA (adenine(2030)-N(6))-methyltransferase RlmJ [Rugamonas apoptosis]|uniref:Ribosomal RNA large subunit methyltransferase J n=1 Tax=Rugamonas apoptosis TaxID=2758570 RepID=A0A7W2IJW0_9BURK|nr:23S rRNA (adenine(2030)-N(6))-methyltransferase RlmJ [Rugamonas apoptosis]MBA5687180.1 23S rRNA (adenine(2030)-N(6))-methyltransferase RlmJ [Rugamonas apoptosis]
MLSYRHAFHAGNHADVLKHFVTIQLLQYLNQKDTAYSYIDTHSGAGVYALDGNFASKNAEFDTGIGPLWDRTDLPAPLKEYVDLVKAMNPSGKMRYYPGSPYCADQVAREQDRLRLFELHPADAKILADNFRKVEAHAAAQGVRPTTRGKRVIITKGDGFQGLKALLPPPSRRALVLCDPPYEDKMDYRKVKDMLAEALGRFPTGTYAVWYPLLHRMESRQFADKLKQLPAEWLNVTLTTHTPMPDGFGLHSSGMFILNPPYTLEPMLKQVMPYLVQALGKDEGARFTLETGTQVTGRSRLSGASGVQAEGRGPQSGARGPQAGARGPQAGARAPQSGERGTQAGGRGPQGGPQSGPRGAQSGPQSGPRGPQSGPQSGPRGPQSGPRNGPSGGRGGASGAGRGPAMAARNSGSRKP